MHAPSYDKVLHSRTIGRWWWPCRRLAYSCTARNTTWWVRLVAWIRRSGCQFSQSGGCLTMSHRLENWAWTHTTDDLLTTPSASLALATAHKGAVVYLKPKLQCLLNYWKLLQLPQSWLGSLVLSWPWVTGCVEFCMFSTRLYRLSLGSPVSSHWPKTCWYNDWLL